ncbi:type II secretion system protein [Limnohabitans sp.]|uniref:type II secretion system protein n=1 Tax=Limnohabitans sp. TaxID=1907725 RepID=UPI00286F9862|nr:type II secretion system protein [Limnohabitans sp.]
MRLTIHPTPNTSLSNRYVSNKQCGSVYLMMLFMVAFVGLAAAAVTTVWSTQRQRDRETELLAVGSEFERAIQRYYESSPGLIKSYPPRLEELLKDNRFLYPKRHLRQIYVDPMTGERDWTLVMAPQGGVMGIASSSNKKPIKTQRFDDLHVQFAGKDRYSQWQFTYLSTSIGSDAAH